MMTQTVLLPICNIEKYFHFQFAVDNLPTESIFSTIFAKVSENIVWI